MTLPDTDSFADYGGAIQDPPGGGVTDPTTDRSAAAMNAAFASAAALTRTAIRAFVSFAYSSPTATLAPESTILIDSPYGVRAATWVETYGKRPTITRVSQGIFDVEWPETVFDELGREHTLEIRRVCFKVFETERDAQLQSQITAPNTIRLRVYVSSVLEDPLYEEVLINAGNPLDPLQEVLVARAETIGVGWV